MIYKNNKLAYNLKKAINGFFVKKKYNYTCQKIEIQHTPIIVVCPCNTKDDAKLVAASFDRPLSFAADASYLEHNKINIDLSNAYTPIPVYPVSNNASACTQIIRRIKAGYSVCVFPEGKRSADGLTSDFTDSIAKLVKRLGVCMVTYKIDGAYMSAPAWAKHKRRGRTHGHTVCIYPAENIRKMSVASIYQAIKSDLDFDAIASQSECQTRYDGKKLAVGIEDQLYVCPCCKYLNTLTSNNNKIFCKKCHKLGEIDAYGNISGFTFTNVRDWSNWQKSMISRLPYVSGEKELAYNENVKLALVKHTESTEILCSGRLSITNISIKVDDFEILFDKIKRIDITFEQNLAFSTSQNKNSHYEILCESSYAANMYLDIYRKYKRQTGN